MLEQLPVPGRSQAFPEVFRALKSCVGSNCVACLPPAFFHRIQIRTISWKADHKNIAYVHINIFTHLFWRVPSSIIHDEKNFLVFFSQMFNECNSIFRNLPLGKFVMKFSMESVRSIHIHFLDAAVYIDNRRRADFAPAMPFICLSPEVCFIDADDFIFICQWKELLDDFFLNALTAASLRFWCCCRGAFHDMPRLCKMRLVCLGVYLAPNSSLMNNLASFVCHPRSVPGTVCCIAARSFSFCFVVIFAGFPERGLS